jgi:amidase
MDRLVKKISKPRLLSHEYSRHIPPLIKIRDGECIIVETEDAFNGLLKSPKDIKKLIGPGALPPNPVTGPIYIEGASPGDTLEISIIDISLGKTGGTCFARTDQSIDTWFDSNFARVYDIQNNVIKFSNRLRVKAKPFIGCIATAPAHFSPSSVQVFHSGGNMDCCQIQPGSKVYLPVCCEGGYLYIGDVHALQADGEFCGTAVETSAQVKIRVNIITNLAGCSLNRPRVETEKLLVTIASGSCLEDAYTTVMKDMIFWLESEYGFDPKEYFLQLSQFTNLRTCNWFTVRCELPKTFLSIK